MTDEEAIQDWIDRARNRCTEGGRVPMIYQAINKLYEENKRARELLEISLAWIAKDDVASRLVHLKIRGFLDGEK